MQPTASIRHKITVFLIVFAISFVLWLQSYEKKLKAPRLFGPNSSSNSGL
jgi:hypothetical protein